MSITTETFQEHEFYTIIENDKWNGQIFLCYRTTPKQVNFIEVCVELFNDWTHFYPKKYEITTDELGTTHSTYNIQKRLKKSLGTAGENDDDLFYVEETTIITNPFNPSYSKKIIRANDLHHQLFSAYNNVCEDPFNSDRGFIKDYEKVYAKVNETQKQRIEFPVRVNW